METLTNEDAYYLGMLACMNMCYMLTKDTDDDLKNTIFYLSDKILSFAPYFADMGYKIEERKLGKKLMDSMGITPNDLSTANS